MENTEFCYEADDNYITEENEMLSEADTLQQKEISSVRKFLAIAITCILPALLFFVQEFIFTVIYSLEPNQNTYNILSIADSISYALFVLIAAVLSALICGLLMKSYKAGIASFGCYVVASEIRILILNIAYMLLSIFNKYQSSAFDIYAIINTISFIVIPIICGLLYLSVLKKDNTSREKTAKTVTKLVFSGAYPVAFIIAFFIVFSLSNALIHAIYSGFEDNYYRNIMTYLPSIISGLFSIVLFLTFFLIFRIAFKDTKTILSCFAISFTVNGLLSSMPSAVITRLLLLFNIYFDYHTLPSVINFIFTFFIAPVISVVLIVGLIIVPTIIAKKKASKEMLQETDTELNEILNKIKGDSSYDEGTDEYDAI